jgi:hypothetical protein
MYYTGYVISNIRNAAFGDFGSCPSQMREVSGVLRDQCLSKQTCYPDFNKGLNGQDPCPGHVKWMDAGWDCNYYSGSATSETSASGQYLNMAAWSSSTSSESVGTSTSLYSPLGHVKLSLEDDGGLALCENLCEDLVIVMRVCGWNATDPVITTISLCGTHLFRWLRLQ